MPPHRSTEPDSKLNRSQGKLRRESRREAKETTGPHPAIAAINERRRVLRKLSLFWREQTGRDQACPRTLATVASYLAEVEPKLVLGWIEKAAVRCASDHQMGRFVSGCRRQHRLELERQGAAA